MDDEGRKSKPGEIQNDTMGSLDFFIILNNAKTLLLIYTKPSTLGFA